MKKMFFFKLLVVLLFSTTLSAEGVGGGLPEFPEYSPVMNLGGGCEADCFLSSCSGQGMCLCSCRWFSCKCVINKEEPAPEEFVSMNKEQYERTKELAEFIRGLKTEETDRVYISLSNMVRALRDRNKTDFSNYRKEYLNNIQSMSDNNKKVLNNYFIKVGALERI